MARATTASSGGRAATGRAAVLEHVPDTTVGWLLEAENPAVAALTRTRLLGQPLDAPDVVAAWASRNDYAPVAAILGAQKPDGSWAAPERDYKKYEGSLWQVHFLGEMWANGADERVQRAADYAFSRQLPDGSWSTNGRPAAAIPCLTANVGRALARLAEADDERLTGALGWIAQQYRTLGYLGCAGMRDYSLNGYCHMTSPKILLFLGEVPSDSWPDGTEELREECVRVLRDKEVYRSLPSEFAAFKEDVWPKPRAKVAEARGRFLTEHEPLHYGEKKGWLRFGYPLSYNSDALEALAALAAVGERRRPEYEAALDTVRSAADPEMRWVMKTSFNGKMLADVEEKGAPSKWLTLRALDVLQHFEEDRSE